LADDQRNTAQVREHRSHLVPAQHDGKASRALGALHALDEAEVSAQDPTVEEHEGVEGLILGRWADAVSHGEVAEEGPDFVGSHLVRMPHPVVEDEPSDPVDVRLFRARAVVKGPDGPPNPIEEPNPYRTAGGREGARSECKSPGGGLE